MTENPFEGGAGYTYAQVGSMTPDQIWHRLTDKKLLLAKVKALNSTTEKMTPPGGINKDGRRIAKVNPDGTINARAADGTPITLRKSGGESLASQLAAEEKAKQGKRRRRRKRKRQDPPQGQVR